MSGIIPNQNSWEHGLDQDNISCWRNRRTKDIYYLCPISGSMSSVRELRPAGLSAGPHPNSIPDPPVFTPMPHPAPATTRHSARTTEVAMEARQPFVGSTINHDHRGTPQAHQMYGSSPLLVVTASPAPQPVPLQIPLPPARPPPVIPDQLKEFKDNKGRVYCYDEASRTLFSREPFAPVRPLSRRASSASESRDHYIELKDAKRKAYYYNKYTQVMQNKIPDCFKKYSSRGMLGHGR